MELRKQKEIEHANKLKNLLEQASDQEKVASNKKFYKITRGNINFTKKWLLSKISDNKKFLDYCCGDGSISIFLAQNNAEITGIDISDVSIKIAKQNASKKGLENNPTFLVMDAENMEFDDNSFDVIFCGGVLHHLDIDKAFQELKRVLKPNGAIICGEPLAYNPIFQLYRRLTPKLRTEWESEHILNKQSINLAKKHFNKVEMKFFHLTTLLAVPFRHYSFFGHILSFFEFVDSILLRLPIIKWLSWQIVFTLSEPKK